jgi:hypothetical protein
VNSVTLSSIALACIFGGMLLGMALRHLLPEHHLSSETKDAVKLGAGMVATLVALVLGLLIASAKGTFDTMTGELRQIGAKMMVLDSVMAQYGPETKEARDLLHRGIATTLQRIWPEETTTLEVAKARQPSTDVEALQDKLLKLSPRNDRERWIQSRALQMNAEIAEARLVLVQQVGESSLPTPFRVLLVCWLTLIFASFGLFSPRNTTVIVALFICALSAAASLFLILELDQPYQGIIKISSAPLRSALAVIGQ